MAYMFSARSTTPGEYRLVSGVLSQLISVTNIRNGTNRGDGVVGTCYVPAAADVEFGVNVDATTGTFVVPAESQVQLNVTYGAAAEFTGTYSPMPAPGEGIDPVDIVAAQYVIEGHDNYAGGVAGTYHEALIAEVQAGVTFGAGQALIGIYSPSVPVQSLFPRSFGVPPSKNLEFVYDNLISNVYPAVDSTSSVQIQKAGGGTTVMRVDTTNSRIAIGASLPAPDGPLHVHSGTAGTVTAVSTANQLVVESSANSGISLLFPETVYGLINFGTPTSNQSGLIAYGGASVSADYVNSLYFKTAASVQMLLSNVGNLGLGTTSFGAGAVKVLTLGNGTAPGAKANTASIVALAGELWAYDAGGVGAQLTSHPLDAPPELYTLGPGKDWLGKQIRPYDGEIIWTTAHGNTVVESFANYNARTGSNLVQRDWDTDEAAQVEKSVEEYRQYRAAVKKWKRLPAPLRGDLPEPVQLYQARPFGQVI